MTPERSGGGAPDATKTRPPDHTIARIGLLAREDGGVPRTLRDCAPH